MKIELIKERKLEKDSQYLQYDKGFNHALMIIKEMLIKQGFEIIEVDEV